MKSTIKRGSSRKPPVSEVEPEKQNVQRKRRGSPIEAAVTRVKRRGKPSRMQTSDNEETELKRLASANRIEKSFSRIDIKKEFDLIMIIWCPTDVVAPDFLATFLSQFEKNVRIHERWNKVSDMSDSPSIFGGGTAKFVSNENFSRAAKALAVSSSHLKSISAKRLLNFILEAEANQPMCGLKNCELIIRGLCSGHKDEYKQRMIEIFSSFGTIEKVSRMNIESVETVELAYDVYETPFTKQDKSPILFLHGLFWNKYMLRELAVEMCNITKRKVYCPDLRCHDQTPFREDFNLDILAEDMKRFIEDRHLEKVAFVCHSISSTVAYLVLLDKPDVVEKVVMIDHPPFLDYNLEVFNEHVYPQFVAQKRLLESLDPSLPLSSAKRKLKHLSEGANSDATRIFLEKAAYELIKVNDEFKWKTDHQFLIENAKEHCVTGEAKGRSDHEILIIRCKDCRLITDKKFEMVLKYNPNAKVKSIDDTTHLLMFEKPEEFLEAVKEFLS